MAAKERTDNRQHTAHLARADVGRAEGGDYLLPIVVGDGDQAKRTLLEISPDEAARLSAQLEYHLNRGLAMTERAKAARNSGERYPVSGSGHLT